MSRPADAQFETRYRPAVSTVFVIILIVIVLEPAAGGDYVCQLRPGPPTMKCPPASTTRFTMAVACAGVSCGPRI